MVLSQRERIVALLALLVVGALVADALVVGPVLRRLRAVENHKQQLLAQLNEAQGLFERRRLMERKWKTMLSDGLQDEAEAESRLVRALDKWSQETRLALTSVKPERVASDKGLNEMTFVVAGQGGMNAVARFLWQVETAELPVKVKDMQLGLASSETGDSMSLELRLSALYLGAGHAPVEKPSRPQPQEANDEEPLL